MSMLRPLMLDVVPGIQQKAALALGRLVVHNADLADNLVKEDILPQLIRSLTIQNVSAFFARRGTQTHRLRREEVPTDERD